MTEHLEPDSSTNTAPPPSGTGAYGPTGSAPDSPHSGCRRQSTVPAGTDGLSQNEKTTGQHLDEIAARLRALLNRLASR